MPRPVGVDNEPCPLTAALEAIGGRWNLVALYWLVRGTRRFNELKHLMPGISHKVLTETLRHLEREGLVVRVAYPEVPPRTEYSVSDHGETTRPIIEALRVWGHLHVASGNYTSREAPSTAVAK